MSVQSYTIEGFEEELVKLKGELKNMATTFALAIKQGTQQAILAIREEESRALESVDRIVDKWLDTVLDYLRQWQVGR